LKTTFYLLKLISIIFINLQKRYEIYLLKQKSIKIFEFLLGKEIVEGFYFPFYIKE
jgi:hypothetical protein